MAKRLVTKAPWEIVNAKSYKMVMTSSSLSGNGLIKFYASFTLVHDRSPTRGDLYRMDTLNFSGPAPTFSAETMKIIPGTSRTEITNEAGNWDMGDGPGKEGIAFLITSNEVPVDTIGMQQAFRKEAEEIESAGSDSTFDVMNGSDGGRPVLRITRRQTYNGIAEGTVYEIDPVTKSLVSEFTSSPDGLRKDFDLSATVDESEFDVPNSLVAAPVKNVRAASEYLYEHK